jgi:hypothetical protein
MTLEAEASSVPATHTEYTQSSPVESFDDE